MSKKSPYILSRHLFQSHLNNKTTAKAICGTASLQQSLERQQAKQNLEINIRRKLHKPANANKRHVTSKDKCRACNCVPNNRRKPTPTTRKNVTRTIHFNANSLWHAENDKEQQQSPQWKCGKDIQKNHNENCYKNFQPSIKALQLQSPQRQLNENNALRICHENLEGTGWHKSFNAIYEADYAAKTCNKNHELPSNVYKPRCQCLHVCAAKSLHLHDVIPSILLASTQRTKCHFNHNHHHHDSQVNWLPQVSQHGILLGMFENITPLFLQHSSACNMIQSDAPSKYQREDLCASECLKYKFQSDAFKRKPKAFHPRRQGQEKQMNLGYARDATSLRKKKSKPSDWDVIFGNACHLLTKHYGWNKSRIEWLLELEQQQPLSHT